MPRFRFPVPGRRQKHEQPAIAPFLSKAQKILGGTDVAVDTLSAALAADPSLKDWDAVSACGISINISETSTNADEGDDVPSSVGGGCQGFSPTAPAGVFPDDESGVLPRKPAPASGTGASDVIPSPTDASSLRRKQSSSTIMSYYDKSKVPLVISQQTSSSAMAKGPPNKAVFLLDIDGSLGKAPKKKPSKLDLSHLLSRRKISSTTPSPVSVSSTKSDKSINNVNNVNNANNTNGGFLSPNAAIRASLGTTPISPAKIRPRVLTKKCSNQSMHTPATKNSFHSQPSMLPHRPRSSAAGQYRPELQTLYDHYEKTSYRNTLAHRGIEPPARDGDAGAPPHSDDFTSDLEAIVEANSDFIPAITENLNTFTAYAPNDLDYSESISSRHTKTSRASKRTSHSLVELDLQQNSVLSLSSDSEDDSGDPQPRTPASAYTDYSGPPGPPGAPDGPFPAPDSRQLVRARAHPSAVERAAPVSTLPRGQFLPIPGTSGNKPPALKGRKVPAKLNLQSGPRPATEAVRTVLSRNPSQLSRGPSSSTRTSATLTPSDYNILEARAITMVPAHGTSYDTASQPPGDSALGTARQPLSPSSVDFYLRSNYTPTMADVDHQSVSSRGSSRFVSVTRQEEMLLAALRRQRDKMRQSARQLLEQEQQSLQVHEQAQEQDQEHDDNDYAPQQAHGGVRPRRMDGYSPHRSSSSTLPGSRTQRTASQTSISVRDLPIHFEGSSLYSIDSVSSSGGGSRIQRSSRLTLRALAAQSANKEGGGDRGSLGGMAASTRSSSGYLSGTEQSPYHSGSVSYGDDDGSSFENAGPPPVFRPPSARVSLASFGQRRAASSSIWRESKKISHRDTDDSTSSNGGGGSGSGIVHQDDHGIPRPDSPVDGHTLLPRKKAVRISAVGRGTMEPWWGDDG